MTQLQLLTRELRRRSVFGAAGIYAVVAWVFVQVASLVFPAIDVPDAALRFVWLAILFLFPLAMVFAWYYDLSSDGLTRTPPAHNGDGFDPSLRRADYVTLGALFVVVISIAWQLTARIEVTPEFDRGSIDPNSIAVLPLDNISGDPDQQYFVSGMQAAMIAGLSRIRALRVTSKTSTLRYRDSPVALPEVGRQLHVAKIIEGSIYRFKDRVRLEVQLLDAGNDEHIWSATFEDEIEDIMILQSRVVQAVASQVRVTLSADEKVQLDNAAKINPAAYEAFLKGQFHVERFTPEDMALAAGYFQQAVKLDPDYALGHWGLAKLCGFQLQAGQITPEEGRERCMTPFLKAMDLDPFLPEAHLGYANQLTWQQNDWARADAAFERAIELNPSYAEGHMFYSHYLGIVGRIEESTAEMLLALKLDPLNPFVHALHGVQLQMTDDFEGAVAVAEEVLAAAPGFGFGYVVTWHSYQELGERDKAIEAAANFFRYTRGNPTAAEALEAIYDGTNYSESLLYAAELLAVHSKTAHVPPMDIGSLYEYAGDIEKAIDWFETAYRNNDPDSPYLGVLSKSPEMHANPRFQQLLRDMKLDYWADRFSQTGN
jgi:TolB-like protein/tetratricopeptide (TPR) repeat protein